MKLRRGSGKAHHGPKRKSGTRDVAAAGRELADDVSPMNACLRGRASSSGTFDDLLDGDFGELAASESDRAGAAIVINVSSGRCRVFHDGVEKDCLLPPQIATRQKSILAVGDRVVVEIADGGNWRIRAILPRHSVLARPDPLNPHLQRLIAANIDVVINVVSLKTPPLRPRLIDRFLIAIYRGGAQPAICVNKIDLVPPDDLGGGTFVIDTPGIRELGLWNLDRDTLRDYFPELLAASELCRFNDCTHLHEPDCEVKARVATGVIHPARYDAYVRLSEEIGETAR